MTVKKQSLFLSICIALMLLLMLNVAAEDITVVASGTCGDNLKWVITSDEVLTISGSGDMTNYDITLDDGTVALYGGVIPNQYVTRCETVVIEEGVTSVGDHAFQNFWIKKVTFPTTLKRIGTNAFSRAHSITEISFPEGCALEELGNGAFGEISMLQNVDLSNCKNLTAIPDNCFYKAHYLYSFTFPAGGNIKSIGSSAFEECVRLSAFTVPETVTSIGSRAFAKCGSMITLTVPASVTSIGDNILAECGTVAVYGAEGSAAQQAAKNNNVKFVAGNVNDNPVILKQGKIGDNIEWSLDSNGKLALAGEGAMQWFGSHSYAPWHADQYSVKSIEVGEGITHIGWEAFCQLEAATTVSLPDSLETIADYAFMSCKGLKEIIIPDKVTSIGECAFYYCVSAERIYIPASLVHIGGYAFYQPNSLKKFEVSPDNPLFSSDEHGVLFNKDKSVLIAYPVGNTASSYTIPASVTKLEQNAFNGAVYLEKIAFAEGAQLKELGGSSFVSCTALKNIVLGDGITKIGERAFYGCNALEVLDVPQTVTEIGDSAFYGSELKSISLPGVKTIGKNAFAQSYVLENVYMPVVETIGDEAFRHCSSLREINIPATTTSIGTNVFLSSGNLTKIIVAPENPSYYTDATGALYTKDMTRLMAFPTVAPISTYAIPEGVTTIDPWAFYQAQYLTSVTFPSTLTTIGANAFERCSGLTEITLPKTVATIGARAFMGCSALAKINIPADSQLYTLERGVFQLTAITEFTVPASITVIGSYAVAGDNLKTVTFAEGTNVRYMSSYPFGSGRQDGEGIKVYLPEGSTAEQAAKNIYLPYSYTVPINVVIDGAKVKFDQQPIIVNNRTLVPMRAIFEALGADVEWEHETYTAVAVKADTTIRIGIDKTEMTKNAEVVQLDAPAILISHRTMVPIRAVSEAFGCDVQWDDTTRTVSIITK